MLLATANPWIYWLSFVLVASGFLVLLAFFIGYLIKVVGAKYPRQP